MPQEIRVVKCVQCEMFQTDIVKKANKWQCTLCGLKQSLRKEYFRGAGADCRLRVQELNLNQGTKQNQNKESTLEVIEDENWQAAQRLEEENKLLKIDAKQIRTDNKWSKYVEEEESSLERISYQGSKQEAFHSTNQEANILSNSSAIKRKSEMNTKANAKKSNSRWQDFV